MKKINIRIPLILILIFTLISHLYFLDRAPSGMTNDELHFILNAKSVYLNFSNLANNWNPLSLTTIPQETSSELPFLLLSPIIGPLPLNLLTARLPHTILSLLCVILIFLISSKLFKPTIAVFVAFITSLNPWFFYVYRTSFDAPIAIFFFLLTFYLLLTLKNWRLLYSIIPITIAFYSYIGTKVIVFPYVFIISIFIYFYYKKRSSLRPLIVINVYSFVLSLIFFINLNHSSIGARTSELITPWNPIIISRVEEQRNLTFRNLFTPVFTNKYLVYFQFLFDKWINSFSPDLLFIKGDETFTGSLWRHGYFYYFDLLLIFLGFLYLHLYYRPILYLLIMLLSISPIPEIIRKDQIPAYVFHSSLQYPILVIITGIGFYYLLTYFKQNYFKYLIIAGYIFLFINLMYIYIYQYPFYAPESFNFSNRLLSNYLLAERQANSSHIYVFSREPDALFKNYIFYSNSLNRNNFSNISTAYNQLSKNLSSIDGISFLGPGATPSINQNDVVIVEEGIDSPPNLNHSSKIVLFRINDKQTVFNIYNGSTCSQSKDKVTVYSIIDLDIKPNQTSLCSKYFTKTL